MLTCIPVPEAHAYIDPGSGSLLLQAVIGGVAAGLVATKFYWHRLKAFFSGARAQPVEKRTSRDNGEEGKPGATRRRD